MRRLVASIVSLLMGVVLVLGGAATAANADVPSSVSGQITDSATGEPLADVKVTLSAYIAEAWIEVVASTTTDSDGVYSFDSPPVFNLIDVFAPSAAYAPPRITKTVYPVAGEPLVFDATFAPFSSISGQLTGLLPSGGVGPVAGADVALFVPGSRSAVQVVSTLDDGSYTFTQLVEGSYTIQFNRWHQAGAYLSQWWDKEPTSGAADVIDLSTGEQRSGVDAELALGGSISGSILRGDGSIDTNASAQLEKNDGGVWTRIGGAGGAITPEGKYRFDGLDAGTYRVGFNLYDAATNSNTTIGYFDSVTDPSQARPLEVELGKSLGGINGVVPGKATPTNTTSLGSIAAGSTVEVSGAGFIPQSTVIVLLESAPVRLGTLTANAAGAVSGSFVIPISTPAGTHHIVLVDSAGNRYEAAFEVAPGTTELAATGVDGIGKAGAAAGILLFLGVLITSNSHSRSPRKRTHAADATT